IAAHYKNIDLVERTTNPYFPISLREMYAKFSAAMNKHIIYQETWKKIEDDITKKIQNRLEEVHQQVSTLYQWEIFDHIRLCEKVLAVLPDHMKNKLEQEIQWHKRKIEDEIENAAETVLKVLKTRDVNNINAFIQKCTPNQKKKAEEQ
ncbi:hypothetical protein RFI_33650, partial [Reticulomyxa filosa]